jgi:hypothetical protein
MSTYFKFEEKIGWSEVVASLALLVSLASGWASYKAVTENRPALSVKEDQVVGGPYFNEAIQRWQHLVYARFIVTNLGGRPTTLLGFEANPRVPVVMGLSGTNAHVSADLVSKYLILDSLPEDIRANPQSIVEAKAVSAERLGLLNMPIEAGSTKVVILGIVFDAYDPQHTRRAEQLLVALDLIFANGYRHTFLGALAVKTLPTDG